MSHLPINTRITLVLDALTRVNEIRAEQGHEPLDALPLGYAEQSCCPVALGLTVTSPGGNIGDSLRAEVSGDHDNCGATILVFDSEGLETEYSREDSIGAFVEAFDRGQLPEYQVPQDGY